MDEENEAAVKRRRREEALLIIARKLDRLRRNKTDQGLLEQEQAFRNARAPVGVDGKK
jgi:hypothetical protein